MAEVLLLVVEGADSRGGHWTADGGSEAVDVDDDAPLATCLLVVLMIK